MVGGFGGGGGSVWVVYEGLCGCSVWLGCRGMVELVGFGVFGVLVVVWGISIMCVWLVGFGDVLLFFRVKIFVCWL